MRSEELQKEIEKMKEMFDEETLYSGEEIDKILNSPIIPEPQGVQVEDARKGKEGDE